MPATTPGMKAISVEKVEVRLPAGKGSAAAALVSAAFPRKYFPAEGEKDKHSN